MASLRLQTMPTYKPGDVSAALFGKKRKAEKDKSLAELFSPSKVSRDNQSEQYITKKQSFQASGATSNPLGSKKQKKKVKQSALEKEFQEEDKQGQVQASSKIKVEKKVKKGKVDVTDTKKIPREIINQKETIKNNADNFSEFPFMHETLLQRNTFPKNTAIKRKNEDEDEQESPIKRMRNYRHRDKTKDQRTIFIGNCSLSADKKSLKTLFRKFGAIDSMRFRCAPAADLDLPRRAVVIKKNFHEQSKSLVAYIVFNEEVAAQKALSMNGHLFHDLHLRVDLASQSRKHDKKKSIFLGNLPFDTKEEELRAHFHDCGEIVNVRVIRDRRTSLGKGIAYVQFESKDSVSLALKLDMSEFKGRPVRVRVCTNNPEKIEERKARQNPKASHTKATPKEKKLSFAPSNRASFSFQDVMKLKKEKRLRKNKKKRENTKKSGDLSAIFGDDEHKKKTLRLKKNPNLKNAKGKRKDKGFKGTSRKSQLKSSKKKGSHAKSRNH